jgi:VanZ family protein
MKPLHRRRQWLALWWTAIALVVVVCLMPPPLLPPLPPNSDKIEHLLGYFALAASAVQIYRRGAVLWLAGVGLVAMGIAIEVLQGALTTTRAQDPYDALANAIGVAFGLATAFTPWRDLLLRWQRAPSA